MQVLCKVGMDQVHKAHKKLKKELSIDYSTLMFRKHFAKISPLTLNAKIADRWRL